MKYVTNDYYQILDVPQYASGEELKAAYRRRVKELHPDVTGVDDEGMVRLNWAYAILSDPHSRAEYDRGLKRSWRVRLDWLPMSREAIEARWVRATIMWVLTVFVLWLCLKPVDLPQLALAMLAGK